MCEGGEGICSEKMKFKFELKIKSLCCVLLVNMNRTGFVKSLFECGKCLDVKQYSFSMMRPGLFM